MTERKHAAGKNGTNGRLISTDRERTAIRAARAQMDAMPTTLPSASEAFGHIPMRLPAATRSFGRIPERMDPRPYDRIPLTLPDFDSNFARAKRKRDKNKRARARKASIRK